MNEKIDVHESREVLPEPGLYRCDSKCGEENFTLLQIQIARMVVRGDRQPVCPGCGGIASIVESDLMPPTKMAEGFHRLDRKVVGGRAAPIKWGEDYLAWNDKHKVQYLEKFAYSMNHAADLMQEERNRLLVVCESQEQKLIAALENRERASLSAQAQMSDDQSEKQKLYGQVVSMSREIRDLNKRIKELETPSPSDE